MSGEPSSTRFRIVLFIILALLIAAIGIVLRIDQPFKEEPIAWPEPAETQSPRTELPRMTRLSPQEAIGKAIEHVKKQYGWTGVADHADREGFTWYVIVRRGSKPDDETRTIAISDDTGNAWENR